MPTVLIADDEPNLAIELASRFAQFWPELELLGMPRNGIEALAAINALRPDFVFLDIRMPGLDGLQIARTVPDVEVVFVTAYDEYAARAFEASAVDYLLKPITDERLLQCIAKLQRGNRLKKSVEQPVALEERKDNLPIQWLTVGYKEATRLVSVNDVLFFQATDKYTEVVTAEQRHIIRTPLKELLPRLDPACFAQVHRSVIVALPEIDRVERDLLGRMRIHLKNRSELLPVSRGYGGLFRQM